MSPGARRSCERCRAGRERSHGGGHRPEQRTRSAASRCWSTSRRAVVEESIGSPRPLASLTVGATVGGPQHATPHSPRSVPHIPQDVRHPDARGRRAAEVRAGPSRPRRHEDHHTTPLAPTRGPCQRFTPRPAKSTRVQKRQKPLHTFAPMGALAVVCSRMYSLVGAGERVLIHRSPRRAGSPGAATPCCRSAS